MHTELEFAVRARNAANQALEHVEGGPAPYATRVGLRRGWARVWHRGLRAGLNRWSTLAAGVVFAVVGYALGHLGLSPARAPQNKVASPTTAPRPAVAGAGGGGNIAWLVNAQDSPGAGGATEMPGRDMRAREDLRRDRGVARI